MRARGKGRLCTMQCRWEANKWCQDHGSHLVEVATPAQAQYLAMEMELLEAGAGQRKVRAVTTVSRTQVVIITMGIPSLILSDLIVYNECLC